jgi:hypothetical protein
LGAIAALWRWDLVVHAAQGVFKVPLEFVRVLIKHFVHTVRVNGVNLWGKVRLDVDARALVKASIAGHVPQAVHDASRDNALTRRQHGGHYVTASNAGHAVRATLKSHCSGKPSGSRNRR